VDPSTLGFTINRRSQTPLIVLPLTLGGGSNMGSFPSGPHPNVSQAYGVGSPHSKPFTTIFPLQHTAIPVFLYHRHLVTSHPTTPPYKSRLITLSACPLHSPITGHVPLSYNPITALHVILVHPSPTLHLPPHTSSDPLTIYYRLIYPLVCWPIPCAQKIPVYSNLTPFPPFTHYSHSLRTRKIIFLTFSTGNPSITITY